ncbi:Protein of unknown function [Gryllus bimaculatus]|nr:Protein of unknown function [Gryllus bimaculatus]
MICACGAIERPRDGSAVAAVRGACAWGRLRRRRRRWPRPRPPVEVGQRSREQARERGVGGGGGGGRTQRLGPVAGPTMRDMMATKMAELKFEAPLARFEEAEDWAGAGSATTAPAADANNCFLQQQANNNNNNVLTEQNATAAAVASLLAAASAVSDRTSLVSPPAITVNILSLLRIDAF